VLIPRRLELVNGADDRRVGAACSRLNGNLRRRHRVLRACERYERLGVRQRELRPYYSEGSKTLAFEVSEQLGWQLPDHVVVPVASGSQLTKIAKGFSELVETGLVEAHDVPHLGRPGRRVLTCRGRLRQRGGSHTPRTTVHDRQVPRHRQSGRRSGTPSDAVRRLPADARSSHRRRDHRRHLPAGTHRGHTFARLPGGVTIATAGEARCRGSRAPRRARRGLRDGQRPEDDRALTGRVLVDAPIDASLDDVAGRSSSSRVAPRPGAPTLRAEVC